MNRRKLLGAIIIGSLIAPVGFSNVTGVGAAALTPSSARLVIGLAGAQPDAAINDFELSANGAWAVFSSSATNLVADDANGVADVFVMKMSSGAITRVSVGADGAEFTEESTNPSICGNGQKVAFETDQDVDLLNDFNFGQDVYVVNRDYDGNGRYDEFSKVNGMSQMLVSVGSLGLATSNGAGNAALSDDCAWVAYDTADELEDNDANGNTDVYVHSTETSDTVTDADGLITSTVNVLISTGLSSEEGGGGYLPTLSADGSLVAFYTSAIDLVAASGGRKGAILHNRDADGDGVFDEIDAGATSREYVSRNDAGTPSAGDPDDSSPMSMTPDGRCIAFKFSTGNDLDTVSEITANSGVYLRDREAGETGTTRIVSYAPVAGEPLAASDAAAPKVSDDCEFVVYDSGDNSLMAEDSNSSRDVFLHDVQRGRTFLVTRTAAGASASGNSAAAAVGEATVDGTVPVYVVSDATSIAGVESGASFERPFRVNYNVLFPNAPRDVAVSVRTGFARQVGISWKAPIGSESLEFAGYKVLYRCGTTAQTAPCNGVWNSLGFTQVANVATHTSTTTYSSQFFTLPVGTATKSVSIAVRAVLNDDDATTGVASSASVTPIDLPTLVATPLTLTAPTATTTSKPITIKINASVASALNGATVSGYTVQYSLNQTAWTSVSAPTGGWKLNSAVRTVTGLKAKTKYFVRLSVATNAGTVTKVLSITTK